MKKWIKILTLMSLFVLSSWVLATAVEASRQIEPMQQKEDCPKTIYLTFDDGPTEYTDKLLDILDAHGMKATFFMLETEMKRYPETVKRLAEEGHGIGLHGVSHEKAIFYAGNTGPLNEMEQANTMLQHIIGTRTSLARTPYGSSPYLTRIQENELIKHDYILWDWNIDSRDWCYRNGQKTFYTTIKMIEQSNKEPKVILFHDIKQSIETMQLMTKWMDNKNYTSKPITTELQPVKLYRKNK